MHYDMNQVDRHHQVNLHESAPPVLIPKRCACGNRAFAKQLDQHGKCVGCQFDERATTLQPEHLDVLLHVLGGTVHHAKLHWGFRNAYLVNHRDRPSIARLMATGFVRVCSSYFHATAAGCKLAGLSGAAIRRAMENQLGN